MGQRGSGFFLSLLGQANEHTRDALDHAVSPDSGANGLPEVDEPALIRLNSRTKGGESRSRWAPWLWSRLPATLSRLAAAAPLRLNGAFRPQLRDCTSP